MFKVARLQLDGSLLMTSTYEIAVSDAASLAGETLIKQLEERQFPAIKLHPLAVNVDSEAAVEYLGEELDLVEAASMVFQNVDYLLIPANTTRDPELIKRAMDAGCIVIDGSANAASQDQILPVLPGINDYHLADARMNRYVAFPSSPAAMLLPAVHAIQSRFGLNRISVTACLSVANTGNEGVSELRTQTVQLLNGKPVDQKAYPHRIAYNLLPQVGEINEEGVSSAEQHIKTELNALLHNQVNARVTCMTVPVFFGDSMVVDLDTDEPMDIYEVQGLLEDLEAVEVSMGAEYSTVEEVAGSDAIKLGRLRQSSVYGSDLSFWLVADNVKRGAVIAVEIAELLIKDLA